MPKFDIRKLDAATREQFRYRLVLSGVLVISLAAALGAIMRTEVRAADGKRQAAIDQLV
jgi:hypothetical protein